LLRKRPYGDGAVLSVFFFFLFFFFLFSSLLFVPLPWAFPFLVFRCHDESTVFQESRVDGGSRVSRASPARVNGSRGEGLAVSLSPRLGKGSLRSLTALRGSRPDWGSTPLERVVPREQASVGTSRSRESRVRGESEVRGRGGSQESKVEGPGRVETPGGEARGERRELRVRGELGVPRARWEVGGGSRELGIEGPRQIGNQKSRGRGGRRESGVPRGQVNVGSPGSRESLADR